jgi:predicted membrane protein
MEKNQQYSLFLWLTFAVLIISRFLLPLFLNIPENLEFLYIFLDFFSLLAGLFAIYYSYMVLENILKKKKKRKMALKSKEEEENK